jgi:hypothetical protein
MPSRLRKNSIFWLYAGDKSPAYRPDEFFSGPLGLDNRLGEVSGAIYVDIALQGHEVAK